MIKLIKSTFYREKETKKALAAFISKAEILSFHTECQKFERNFAQYQGRKFCVMVNSGSSANLAVLQALLNLGRVKKGDKIGFSALTWSTNVMPIIELGLVPIPIDIELDTLNISSRKLRIVVQKEKLAAVFVTNLLGFCDDLEKIQNICVKKNILLLEDNCESLGTVYKGKKLGNFGTASTFSFYVGHHMSTIEGGAVCTDDEELDNMLRLVRAHGWDRNLGQQQQEKMRTQFKVNSTFYSRYTFYDLGYNFRPTEIAGFLGNYQLKFLPEILKHRNSNFLSLAPTLFAKNDWYYPVRYQHLDFCSNFAFPLVCKSMELRDQLVKKCTNKVEIRPIVGGDMTQQPFFAKHVRNGWKQFMYQSNAKRVHECGLYFGNNPDLTERELKTLLEIFTPSS